MRTQALSIVLLFLVHFWHWLSQSRQTWSGILKKFSGCLSLMHIQRKKKAKRSFFSPLLHQCAFGCNNKTKKVKTSDFCEKTKNKLQIKYVELCKMFSFCILNSSNMRLPKHFCIFVWFFCTFNALNCRKRFNGTKICHKVDFNVSDFLQTYLQHLQDFVFYDKQLSTLLRKFFFLTWIMAPKSDVIEFQKPCLPKLFFSQRMCNWFKCKVLGNGRVNFHFWNGLKTRLWGRTKINFYPILS